MKVRYRGTPTASSTNSSRWNSSQITLGLWNNLTDSQLTLQRWARGRVLITVWHVFRYLPFTESSVVSVALLTSLGTSFYFFIPCSFQQLLPKKAAGVLQLCCGQEDAADGWACWAWGTLSASPSLCAADGLSGLLMITCWSRNPAKRLWLDNNHRLTGRSWFWFSAWAFFLHLPDFLVIAGTRVAWLNIKLKLLQLSQDFKPGAGRNMRHGGDSKKS